MDHDRKPSTDTISYHNVRSILNDKFKNARRQMKFPSAKLCITGIFVVLGGGFNFGFQVSIINPTGEHLQQFLIQSLESRYVVKFSELSKRIFWSSVAGILFFGAVIGATIIPPVINGIGSRWSFVIIGISMIIALLLSPLSKYTNIAEFFIISRFLVGICIGMSTTVQGVFITEISPVCYRGIMGALSGLSTNIGALLASMLGLPQIFGTNNLWPYCYLLEVISCLMFICHAIFFLHESPLYFLKRMNEKCAKEAIKFYNPKVNYQDDDGIVRSSDEDEIEKFQVQLRNENELKNSSWIKFWKDNGIMAMVFFGTTLLSTAGFTPSGASLANCLAGLSGTVGILVQAATIDNIGRRFLLIGSLSSLILVNFGMIILIWTYHQHSSIWLGYCFLLLFILFLFFFSVGIGPVAWFIATELTEPYSRAQVQSLSISAQYITCFLCPIFYLPLEKLIGPFSFLIFIIPLTFTTIYIYYCMPETRNRSVDEIQRLLKGE
uniref:Major facilitator superfamily (MFS) profile domain-containing protein n=1 Tax=Setaria digitata TaxID=48799 RepID=A0A915PZG0_9BILA